MDWIGRISSQKESAGKIENISKRIERNATKPTKPIELAKPIVTIQPFIINGELIIPHNSADKYRWWAGGQSLFDTLVELNAPDEIIGHYIGKITSPDAWRRWQALRKE